jgi:hypothetical protein
VWSFFVVLLLPRRDLSSRVEQVLKPTYRQTFFSQAAVKALDMRILRRLSWLNMYQLDLPLYAPRQKMPAG